MAELPTIPPSGPQQPPQPPPLELQLAQLANQSLKQGADPDTVTQQLRTVIGHLRANPDVAADASDALARGIDIRKIGKRIYDAAEMAANPPARESLPSRVLTDLETMGSNLVHHPGETIAKTVGQPVESFFNMLAPGVGEARPNPNLSKGGNSANVPLNQPAYDKEHGAVTSGERAAAAGQVAATIAAPGIAKIAKVGAPLAGATVGASFRPDDPLAGAVEGAALSSAGKPVAALAKKARMRFQPEAQADQALLGAAKRSGVTPEATRAVPVESPTTVLDVADQGSPLQRLARQAWNVPTSTAQQTLGKFLTTRSAGAGDRIRSSLSDATGHVATDTDLPIEARIEQRAAEAKPLYEKAYAHGEIKDPETIKQVKTLLSNPTFAKAWQRGQSLAELDGDTPMATASSGPPAGISPERWKELQAQGMDKYVLQQLGERDMPQGPTVRQLDYWKRGLDAQIESSAGSENALSRTEAFKYRQKLRDVLKRVDKEVPAYQQARENFAGNSDLLEAAQAGAEHFNPSNAASYLQRTLPERFPTAGERAAYQENAINAFVQKVRNLAANPDLPQAARGTNLVQRLMGTEDAGQKLSMLFPDGRSYQQFVRQMEQEARYPQTQRFLMNQSSTAGQLAEGSVDPALWFELARAAGGSPSARLRVAMRALKADGKMRPAVADALANRMTRTGPELQQLMQLFEEQQARRAGRGGRPLASGLIAGSGGQDQP